VSLLRAHAGEHLLLGVARRSTLLRDTLLLGTDLVVPRHYRYQHAQRPGAVPAEMPGFAADSIAQLVDRVLDELVQPLHDIQLDNAEFACLKAIVFFDPGTHARTHACPASIRYFISEETVRTGWWRGTVVERRSLAGELSLSCARPADDG